MSFRDALLSAGLVDEKATKAAERETAHAAVAKVASEHARSVRRGSRRWYVAQADGRVTWLELDAAACRALESGQLAILEHDGATVVIDGAAAKRLLDVAPEAIACLNLR